MSALSEPRKKNNKKIPTQDLDFKIAKDLLEDFKTLKKYIQDETEKDNESKPKEDGDRMSLNEFAEMILPSRDMKYFLINNDLDYNLFKIGLKKRKFKFIE